MSNGQSKEQMQVWILLIAIVFVGLGILVLNIKIAIIHFYQNMFWISLIAIPVFLILSIIFFLWSIFKRENENYIGWYEESDLFDKPSIFILAVVSTLFFILAILLNSYTYEKGYSNSALQKLAEYEEKLKALEQIQSILTGEIIWEVQNQAIEETIDNLCRDSNYNCNQIRQSYEVYKSIKGLKEDADSIARTLGWIKKIEDSRNNK